MISLKIPNIEATNRFIEKQKLLDFTYFPNQYFTQKETTVKGYDNDYQYIAIGKGQKDFEKAKILIQQWQMFPQKWTKILPENAPIQKGTIVAMYANFLGLWFRNSCKIIYTIQEKNRFGFAYGTLPAHIEQGEELFLVEINEKQEVFYTIKAFSKPRHWTAKIAYPIVRMLQEKFRKDSAQQMSNLLKQA